MLSVIGTFHLDRTQHFLPLEFFRDFFYNFEMIFSNFKRNELCVA
jgi:hypothetical protein